MKDVIAARFDSAQDCLAIEPDLLLVRFGQSDGSSMLHRACDVYGEPMLCLVFVQQGQLRYQDSKARSWTFEAGQSAALLLSQPAQALRCQSIEDGSGLYLLLGEPTLCRYMGAEQGQRVLGSRGEAPLLQRASTADIRCHVQSLTSNLIRQPASLLEIHLHVLNLLLVQLKHLQAPVPGANSRLPGTRLQRLEQARQLMLDELDRPLTVEGLARRVGLGVATLTEGFHQLFQTTPYRMLQDLRMQRAFALLQDGCQVAQVGYKVGYNHPSNFSAAFSLYFGFAPKQVSKGRVGMVREVAHPA
ncbi:helix-turn-helix transcriptional regulator [Pseudomonas wadenswilerensis]